MSDDSAKKDNDLIIFREEIKTISNDLFDIIKIPFEKTTELQRHITATFAFGIVNAIAMKQELTSSDAHALAIIM